MSLGHLALMLSLWSGSSERDSLCSAEWKARVPADIRGKLQAKEGRKLDSTLARPATVGERRSARQEKERLLQSLTPQERARVEAALKDLERAREERRKDYRLRQEGPRFRE